MAVKERNIILVGKMGNGKSSTGNSLLKRSAFKTNKSLNAVTQACELRKGSYRIENTLFALTVVDTPGLMDPEVSIGKRLLDIQQAIEMCPSPHAFLLIFSSSNRITKDEEFTIDYLRIAFGERVFDHCIVVFTRGGDFETDQQFKTFWKESGMIGKLVQRCGERIIRIENESSVDLEDNKDVKQILEMIEKMSQRGNKTYQYVFLDTHRKVIKEHLKNNESSGDYQKELSFLVRAIGKHLSGDVWKVMLVGGLLLAVSTATVGAAGVGAVVVGKTAVELAMAGTLKATVVNGVLAVGSTISAAAVSLVNFWRR